MWIEDLEERELHKRGRENPCHFKPISMRRRNGGSERGDKCAIFPFTGGRGAMVIRDP